jgi:hypothetical protein
VSWDLYLVPEEHANDAHEWLESLVGQAGDGVAAADHSAAIRARRPELEVFEVEEGVVELSAPEESEFPLQVYLDGHHAAVSVAYWDVGERAGDLADFVADVVEALRERTGWVAFDPQEDRVIDLQEVRRAFVSGHEHGVEMVRMIDASERPSAQRPRRRRRFFGLFGG